MAVIVSGSLDVFGSESKKVKRESPLKIDLVLHIQDVLLFFFFCMYAIVPFFFGFFYSKGLLGLYQTEFITFPWQSWTSWDLGVEKPVNILIQPFSERRHSLYTISWSSNCSFNKNLSVMTFFPFVKCSAHFFFFNLLTLFYTFLP